MKTTLLCLGVLLVLTACNEQEVPAQVIRPAQVWETGNAVASSGAAYSGEVQARYQADLAFRVGGKVQSRLVNLGDHVKQGAVLARLDTRDLDLGLASARASLAAAEADYKNASAELTRLRDLYAKKFIGRSQLDAAQAAHDAAQAGVRSARAQVDISNNQAGYTDLVAERAGVVTRVDIEEGQVVAAGLPAFHIAYDGEREVALRVGESTVNSLSTGASVVVKLWSGDVASLAGTVREVSPATDANRSYLVKVSLDNPPANLRLGITADVMLPLAATGDATWLPASALFQQGDRAAVWVVGEENSVQLKPVTISAFHETGALVTGLPRGTRLIAAGVHKLHAGQVIDPVPYDGKAGS